MQESGLQLMTAMLVHNPEERLTGHFNPSSCLGYTPGWNKACTLAERGRNPVNVTDAVYAMHASWVIQLEAFYAEQHPRFYRAWFDVAHAADELAPFLWPMDDATGPGPGP